MQNLKMAVRESKLYRNSLSKELQKKQERLIQEQIRLKAIRGDV